MSAIARRSLEVVEWPTRSIPSGAVAVRPEGRLDNVTAPAFREQLVGLVARGCTRLVVDLSGVDAIDSSGLGALISGFKAARESGGELRIAAPNDRARTIFETTTLDRILKMVPVADEAFEETA